MKRTWRIALAVVVLLALAAGGTAWWLRDNLDRLVKEAIERYGSEMTGARVTVRSVKIRVADGEGVIQGLRIANPPGFKTAHLVAVEELRLAVDVSTVTGAVIRLPVIAVNAPDVIYEKGDATTNIEAVQRNIAKYLGPGQKQPSKDEKKLIVDLLTIRNARAQASAAFMGGSTVSLSLPDITLRDVGKAKGGVTPGELGNLIAEALRSRLTGAFSFDRLKEGVGRAVDSAGKAIRGIFK